MKNYIVTSLHDVYIDSFEEGEGEIVNTYTHKAEIKAESIKSAIEKYFQNELYFSFDIENSTIDEENKNILYYSNLVDAEDSEASVEDEKKWKKGKLELYSNNTSLQIFELIQQEISK